MRNGYRLLRICGILLEKALGKPDGSRTQTGFYRLFCVNTALKCLTIRQYSFTILPCLNKNQADINCKHLSVRSFCDNCAAIEAVWLGAIILSHEHGFYLLICFHIALKILEIHAGISALFALSENISAKLKLLCTCNTLVEYSLVL